MPISGHKCKRKGDGRGGRQRLVQGIGNVMESFGVSVEKAMDSLKISQGERPAVAGMVSVPAAK